MSPFFRLHFFSIIIVTSGQPVLRMAISWHRSQGSVVLLLQANFWFHWGASDCRQNFGQQLVSFSFLTAVTSPLLPPPPNQKLVRVRFLTAVTPFPWNQKLYCSWWTSDSWLQSLPHAGSELHWCKHITEFLEILHLSNVLILNSMIELVLLSDQRPPSRSSSRRSSLTFDHEPMRDTDIPSSPKNTPKKRGRKLKKQRPNSEKGELVVRGSKAKVSLCGAK